MYALLVVAAVGAGAYLAYSRTIAPLWREAAELERRIERVRRDIDALPEKAQALARVREEYVAAVNAVEEFEVGITRREDVPYLLRDLEDACNKSGVSVASVSTDAIRDSSPYAELPVTVTVSGSYSQVAAFVRTLLSKGRAMSVSTLRLAASGDETGPGGAPVLEATFALTVFLTPQGGRAE